ncbi:hypothetical protein OCK74_15005 [Chitinophagaceae bacterium LB-8]|uniref:Uncharacterized protein n=1 Tax=Paraflavisolibacter caeni TaxID=2982496 RepID=A0A9X2XZP6_9BACT|nr:hypothetical protein [Paraflavisolibacter caeni]MCU7550428.1 hypothetical protein [Paraflavisolibacter caeni]
MITRTLQLFVLAAFFLTSCSKNGESKSFSNIYVTDRYGQMLAGDTSDGQWRSKYFTDSELAHFSSLDTIKLTGTTKPSFWHVTYAYSNPFAHYTNVSVNAEGNEHFFKTWG